jgi:hypothetical protein
MSRPQFDLDDLILKTFSGGTRRHKLERAGVGRFLRADQSGAGECGKTAFGISESTDLSAPGHIMFPGYRARNQRRIRFQPRVRHGNRDWSS